jgi:hypothetical protein
MSELTRVQAERARHVLRRDARRELWLIPQALVAVSIVVAIVWVRQAFFV